MSRKTAGRLQIGDDWNAITIIALSQNDPLKALAEFVENSIDAGAKNITIVRGKEKGKQYLKIIDDGAGVPRDKNGIPDFHYVATHICDSVKRNLSEGSVQGEFGIGLLSFWTVGEELTMTCSAADGDTYQLTMAKGEDDYAIRKRRTMFPQERGTELQIKPLLPGIRQLSGEKIQWYLASELRDRIRQNKVDLRVVDRSARKEFKVEPREFSGQLIRDLPSLQTVEGDIYLELYLTEPGSDKCVGLYRNGTRVLSSIADYEGLKPDVWSSGYVEGIVDIPFLNLTPGSRLGVIRDDKFARAWFALRTAEGRLEGLIAELRKAEEERTSKAVLKSIQKAFREALLALPAEEYDWFDINETRKSQLRPAAGADTGGLEDVVSDDGQTSLLDIDSPGDSSSPAFFDVAGPLYRCRISPATAVLAVGAKRDMRAIARDKRARSVEQGLAYRWEVLEGPLSIEQPADAEFITVKAGATPGLARLKLVVTQDDVSCEAESLVTITDSLDSMQSPTKDKTEGLPGYTYQYAAGELWRSRYDGDQHVIVVNNGHRDFVYASASKALKLRYIARLYAKELVLKNFPGLPPDKLLERMIELSLYSEEHLR
jgi:hypothetical protein